MGSKISETPYGRSWRKWQSLAPREEKAQKKNKKMKLW